MIHLLPIFIPYTTIGYNHYTIMKFGTNVSFGEIGPLFEFSPHTSDHAGTKIEYMFN